MDGWMDGWMDGYLVHWIWKLQASTTLILDISTCIVFDNIASTGAMYQIKSQLVLYVTRLCFQC